MNSTNFYSSLPVWDSFEALYFLFSGFFVGIVLGVLFTSLWRTLRRRFTKVTGLFNSLFDLPSDIHSPLEVFIKKESPLFPSKTIKISNIVHAFVLARYAFQNQEFRESIKIYSAIIMSDKASRSDIVQALFELSQVYESLHLFERSYDSLYELLHYENTQRIFIEKAIKLYKYFPSYEKIENLLKLYKGQKDIELKYLISKAYIFFAESNLKKENYPEAQELARKAFRWFDKSAHAHVVFWMATSSVKWSQSHDGEQKWLTLALVLSLQYNVSKKTKVSPYAFTSYLSHLLVQFLEKENNFENFSQKKDDFLWQSKFLELPETEKLPYCKPLILSILSIYGSLQSLQKKILDQLIESLAHPPLSILYNEALKKSKQSQFKEKLVIHECCLCHALHKKFLWECPSCRGLEPLQVYEEVGSVF